MSKYKGHCDVIDKMGFWCWAINLDDPTDRPRISVVQNDIPILTVATCTATPHLRSALGLAAVSTPPLYGWHIPFPMSAGLQPDVPFSLVFESTAQPLDNGMGRRLSLIGVKDEDVLYDLSNEVFATYSYGLQGESELQVAVTLRASSDYRPVAVDFGKSLKGVQLEWRPERYVMSTHVAVARGTISAIDRDKTVVFNFERESDVARLNSNSKLRQLAVPQSLFDSARLKFPLPSADNIARVSGPLSTKHHYLVGGFTTFKQIASLVSTYGRTPLDKMTCIVDWGVGCARVARQFVEGADELNMAPIAPNSYLGYDVDPVNVEWCSRNMAAFGSYHLLSRSGFDLDKSADLLFGVSVFTHLTEADQLLWLQGIHRVVRPGGLVIVTTHG